MRALLAQPGFVVMPAVWDGLSAKLASKAGFKTAFLSGSCCAASRLGGPDLDLISFGEMLDCLVTVRNAAPDTLVLADGDHGYGNAMNVQRTVASYGRAGAAAVLIEDKITPRALTSDGKPCMPREEVRMKIRAAVEAAKDSGILVMARTDCRPTAGLEEALARIVEGGDDVLLERVVAERLGNDQVDAVGLGDIRRVHFGDAAVGQAVVPQQLAGDGGDFRRLVEVDPPRPQLGGEEAEETGAGADIGNRGLALDDDALQGRVEGGVADGIGQEHAVVFDAHVRSGVGNGE